MATTLMYLENNEHMTSCSTMIVYSLVTLLIPIHLQGTTLSMVAKRYSHESKYRGKSSIGESLANLQIIIL